MPELPEVETIVRDLRKKIIDYTIVDFWTEWEKSIKFPLKLFKKKIIGQKIEKIKRRGKNILIFLENKQVLWIHLKMTGHLLFKDNQAVKNKYFQDRVNQYIRHIWFLEKNKEKVNLEFSDLRKFGKIQLLDKKKLITDKDFIKLGVEPLGKNFSFEYFWNLTRNKENKNIKVLIMDQALIVGVGNIYASEALFQAKINPLRTAGSLTKAELKKLHQAIIDILGRAIKLRGTSDSDYRDSSGAPGGFQKVLKVYNRESEVCYNCKYLIKRTKIGQRSTFWCSNCQK